VSESLRRRREKGRSFVRSFVPSFVHQRKNSFVRFRSFVRSLSFVRFRSFASRLSEFGVCVELLIATFVVPFINQYS